MHKLIKLTVAIGLLAGSTGYALAQDVKVGAGAGVGVDAGAAVGAAGASAETKANANASAHASGEHNFGSLISSINGKAKLDLSGVTDATNVNIVLVSSLKGEADADAQALDNALSKEAESLTTLRADIGANATVKAKVESAGYKVENIVAAKLEADGSLTVYIDDRG